MKKAKNAVTTTRDKKAPIHTALREFFMDRSAYKVVLVPEGIRGADTAVLCEVVGNLYRSYQVGTPTCVQVSDNVTSITRAIDDIITNFTRSYDPSKFHIRILTFGLGEIDLRYIAQLSNSDHRIITTILACMGECRFEDSLMERRDLVDLQDRYTVTAKGSCIMCDYFDNYETYKNPVKEMAEFIRKDLISCSLNGLIKAVDMFVKGSKKNYAKFPPYFEPDNKNEDVQLLMDLDNDMIHQLYYKHAVDHGTVKEYIEAISSRILSGKLFRDETLSDAIDFCNLNDTDNREIREIIDAYQLDGFESNLVKILREEIDAYCHTIQTILSTMVSLNTCDNMFAAFNGIKFRVAQPGVVMFSGDPTTELPYEASAIKYIMHNYAARTVKRTCDDSWNSEFIPFPTNTDCADDDTDYGVKIAFVIKSDPNSGKFRIIINKNYSRHGALDLTDVINIAFAEFKISAVGYAHSAKRIDRTLFDLDSPTIYPSNRKKYEGEDD